jgi:transcriptional regulator with XRE-family HTH domain
MTLRELRERKGLTQAEVVALSRGELDQTTISQLELGKVRDPRHSTMQRLADAYSVRLQVIADALVETIREVEAV